MLAICPSPIAPHPDRRSLNRHRIPADGPSSARRRPCRTYFFLEQPLQASGAPRPPHAPAPPTSRPPAGFSLLEILLVVSILAILAALVLPHTLDATAEARQRAQQTDLTRIRQQIRIYREHHGKYPELARFAEQMTGPTDADGEPLTAKTSGSFGPYLIDIPENPMTQTADIGNGEPGTSAWYYDQTTGQFNANDSAASRAW